jgi:hypothetical protein
MTYGTAGGPVPFPFVSVIEYPSHFRTDAQMPGGTVTQVLTSESYWVQDARGVQSMASTQAGPARAAADRDIIRLLTRAAAGTLVVHGVDSEDPLVGAIEIVGEMGPVTLFINRDNGLIERAQYDAEAEGRASETYSDYRNVNGIQVPFHTVVRRGALTPIERDIKTIRFNVRIDPALFVRPS